MLFRSQGARDAGVSQVYYCADREKARDLLPQLICPDTTFLVKASRGMKLEALSEFLKEHTPEP